VSLVARRSPTAKPAGREQRTFHVELRAGEARADGEMPTIVGYAAKFDREANIGDWFTEVIRPGAFARAIAEDDVRALFNHDPNYVLGRNVAGTLVLAEDATGLRIEVTPPDTQWARDLVETIRRGDVDQMSFAFRVVSETWTRREGQTPDVLRELVEVRLYDVSPVTYPAYEDTEVGVRDMIAGRLDGDGLTPDERAALTHLLSAGDGGADDDPEARGADVATLRRRLGLAAA
jgi:HK97 family phage prohead protease